MLVGDEMLIKKEIIDIRREEKPKLITVEIISNYGNRNEK